MNCKYFHPLFEPCDEELALEYLTKHFERYSFIDEDDSMGAWCIRIINDISREDEIRERFGVNIVTMANYLCVQNAFLNFYHDHILEYLNALGINARYVVITPHNDLYEMAKKKYHVDGKYRRNMSALLWNPKVKWIDLNDYPNHFARNIISPLREFMDITLEIDLPGWAESFVKSCDEDDLLDKLKQAENNGECLRLRIHLLPSVSYKGILNVLDRIHRYL